MITSAISVHRSWKGRRKDARAPSFISGLQAILARCYSLNLSLSRSRDRKRVVRTAAVERGDVATQLVALLDRRVALARHRQQRRVQRLQLSHGLPRLDRPGVDPRAAAARGGGATAGAPESAAPPAHRWRCPPRSPPPRPISTRVHARRVPGSGTWKARPRRPRPARARARANRTSKERESKERARARRPALLLAL